MKCKFNQDLYIQLTNTHILGYNCWTVPEALEISLRKCLADKLIDETLESCADKQSMLIKLIQFILNSVRSRSGTNSLCWIDVSQKLIDKWPLMAHLLTHKCLWKAGEK
jgi:hypothetical protein